MLEGSLPPFVCASMARGVALAIFDLWSSNTIGFGEGGGPLPAFGKSSVVALESI